MRNYKRTPKSSLHDTVKRYQAGHPKAHKASILTQVMELPQRESLLRLQRDITGLIKSRAKIQRRIATANELGNDRQVTVLATLLARQTLLLQSKMQELANARSEIVNKPKPKPKKRNTRNTKAHSKVTTRKLTKKQEKTLLERVATTKAQAPTETTRELEADRQRERQAFIADLKSR